MWCPINNYAIASGMNPAAATELFIRSRFLLFKNLMGQHTKRTKSRKSDERSRSRLRGQRFCNERCPSNAQYKQQVITIHASSPKRLVVAEINASRSFDRRLSRLIMMTCLRFVQTGTWRTPHFSSMQPAGLLQESLDNAVTRIVNHRCCHTAAINIFSRNYGAQILTGTI